MPTRADPSKPRSGGRPLALVTGASSGIGDAFARALAGTGVRAQAPCPGLTLTEVFRQAGSDTSALPSFLWMEPAGVVSESLRALDHGDVVCVPGLGNRALATLVGLLPHAAGARLAELVTGRVREGRRPSR